MTITEVRAFPTTVGIPGGGRAHESCLRSFNIVAKLRELIAAGTPPAVLLELLDEMKDAPQAEWNTKDPHPANASQERP